MLKLQLVALYICTAESAVDCYCNCWNVFRIFLFLISLHTGFLAYVHKKITRSNLKCAVGLRSSSVIIQTRLKSPNNRAASRTVVRKSSMEGHYVCVEELDIVKMKIFMTYSIYYFIFQFGGLATFCEGISPTKPPHSDVTGHKQLLSFGAQNVTCYCTQQLLKTWFWKFQEGQLPVCPLRLWVSLPSTTWHVNCKSWFPCRSSSCMH